MKKSEMEVKDLDLSLGLSGSDITQLVKTQVTIEAPECDCKRGALLIHSLVPSGQSKHMRWEKIRRGEGRSMEMRGVAQTKDPSLPKTL